MFAQQMGCRLLHGGSVQGLRHPVHIPALKDAGFGAVPNPVQIGFGQGIQPGVEPG